MEKTIILSSFQYERFKKLQKDIQFKEKKSKREGEIVDLLVRIFRRGWEKS